MANEPAENRDVRGNDINPAKIGARGRVKAIHAVHTTTTAGSTLVPEDLTARNGENGELAIHDGTGTADPGLYRFDGTDWAFTEGTGVI